MDHKFQQGPSSHKHFIDLYYPICQDPHNILFQDEILVGMIFYQILFSFDYYFNGQMPGRANPGRNSYIPVMGVGWSLLDTSGLLA